MEEERDIRDRLIRIETKLDNLGKIETQSSEAYNLSKENEKRLDKIEDNNKWLFRTAIGAVITGCISIIIGAIITFTK